MSTQMIVVSDDPRVHRMAGGVAKRRSFQIVSAENEEEFCRACAVGDPGVVVIDLDFGVDAFSLLGTIGQDHRGTVVVLIGGCDRRTLNAARRIGSKRGLKMGPALLKPITEETASREILDCLPAGEAALCRDDIVRAIEQDEFRLYYQPLVRVGKGISFGAESLYGVEALLRWEHPVHGLLQPGRVIPLIEAEGMIGDVTAWVARTGCRQHSEWRKRGWDFKLSINVAAEELKDEGFADAIAKLARDEGMGPGQLVLEVTESQVVAEELQSLETLVRLRLQGIELAIDDFGTGYSSLGRLHKMPFNEFKIDKSFIMTAHEDKHARDIARISTDLGHSQDMIVVAEGVSSRDAWNIVASLECDVAQGFFISKPLPIDEFDAWLVSLDGPHEASEEASSDMIDAAVDPTALNIQGRPVVRGEGWAHNDERREERRKAYVAPPEDDPGPRAA